MLIDMPLEKLKTYTGINPRPADFDEFWDRSIAEMLAVDPQIELVPAKFQTDFAECFDLFFTGHLQRAGAADRATGHGKTEKIRSRYGLGGFLG